MQLNNLRTLPFIGHYIFWIEILRKYNATQRMLLKDLNGLLDLLDPETTAEYLASWGSGYAVTLSRKEIRQAIITTVDLCKKCSIAHDDILFLINQFEQTN